MMASQSEAWTNADRRPARQLSTLKIDTMTVILKHRSTEAEKAIKIPPTRTFKEFLSAVRSIEPNPSWEIWESLN
jgi:hypothetical protein